MHVREEPVLRGPVHRAVPLIPAAMWVLILLASLPFISAQSIDSSTISSISQLPISGRCTPFWPTWGSLHQLSVPYMLIYYPPLHASLVSTELSAMQPQTPESGAAYVPSLAKNSVDAPIQTSLKGAQTAYSNAQDSVRRAQSEYAIASDEMEHILFFFNVFLSPSAMYNHTYLIEFYSSPRLQTIPIEQRLLYGIQYGAESSDPFSFSSRVLDYPNHWQNAMGNQSSALAQAALAVDTAYLEAQSQADELEHMGAADPSYAGAAHPPLQQWKLILSRLAYWSEPSRFLGKVDTTEKRYALVRRLMGNYQSTCRSPGDLPLFNQGVRVLDGAYAGDANVNDASSVPPQSLRIRDLSDAYNLMVGPGNETLWAQGWFYEGQLALARKGFMDELASNQTAAQALQNESTRLETSLKSEHPEQFIRLLNLTNLPSGPNEVQPITNISDTYSAVQSLLLQAQVEWDAAEGAKNSGASSNSPLHWGSNALTHYGRALFDYRFANARTLALQMRMGEETNRSRANAIEALIRLSSRLENSDLNVNGGRAAMAGAALRLYNEANRSFMSGELNVSLGIRYSNYEQAAALAQEGLNTLAGTTRTAPSYEINSSLAHFKDLLAAGRAMEADVSGMDAVYSDLQGFANQPNAHALAGIESQTNALRGRLHAAMADDARQYETLRAQAIALQSEDSSLLTRYDHDFALYRKANGWSDAGYIQFKKVQDTLSSWQSKLSSVALPALARSLCERSRWMANAPGALIAGQDTDTGGRWASSSVLAMDWAAPISFDCPLSADLHSNDVTAKSSNLVSAAASAKTLHLSLSHLAQNDLVWVDFHAIQRPARLTPSACLLSIDDDGKMMWQGNYSLALDNPAALLQINLPWLPAGSGSAYLSRAGFADVAGTFTVGAPSTPVAALTDSNTTDVVQFRLADMPNGTFPLTATIRPSQLATLQQSNDTLLSSPGGWLSVSMQRTYSNLPVCDHVQLAFSQSSGASIQDLSIQSPDGTVEGSPQLISIGSPHWTARLRLYSPSSSSLHAALSYRVNDTSNWSALQIQDLSASALMLNDTLALSMLNDSQLQLSIGDWAGFAATLQKVRNRLYAQAADPHVSQAAWMAEWNATQWMLARLDSFSNSPALLASSAPWASSLAGWRANLSLAFETAKSMAQSGQYGEAISILRNARGATNQSMLITSSNDYHALDLQLSASESSSPQDAPSLSSSSQLISDAFSFIQQGDPLTSLDRLAKARASLSQYNSQTLQSATDALRAQSTQAQSLNSQADALVSQLSDYSALLKSLSSSNTLSQSSLTSARADSLQAMLKKAHLSLDDSPKISNASQAIQLVATRQSQLDSLNQNISSARRELTSALYVTGNTTLSLYRSASAYAAQAHLSTAPNSSAASKLATIDQDLDQLESLISKGEWQNALPLAESVNSRAKSLASTATPASSSELPLPIIAITLLLIIAIAYVLFVKGKGGGGNKPLPPTSASSFSPSSFPPPNLSNSSAKKLERAE